MKAPPRVKRSEAFEIKGRRRRTLPPSLLGSTIRPARLNDRVRDGNGCDPRGKAADQICDKGTLRLGGLGDFSPRLPDAWSPCLIKDWVGKD